MCDYICDLGKCDSYWDTSEIEFACRVSTGAPSYRQGQSSAHVNLASKGVNTEAESSNAGYYIAGASVLGAAAVAYIVTSKKG